MITTTIGKLAENLSLDYAIASALVKFAVAKGQGKEVGKQPTATGKGKPAVIYELPEEFTVKLVA